IFLRARDGDADQKPGAIHRANIEATRNTTALADCRAKRNAADGPDSVCAAKRERLGRWQSLDHNVNIVVPLQFRELSDQRRRDVAYRPGGAREAAGRRLPSIGATAATRGAD